MGMILANALAQRQRLGRRGVRFGGTRLIGDRLRYRARQGVGAGKALKGAVRV